MRAEITSVLRDDAQDARRVISGHEVPLPSAQPRFAVRRLAPWDDPNDDHRQHVARRAAQRQRRCQAAARRTAPVGDPAGAPVQYR